MTPGVIDTILQMSNLLTTCGDIVLQIMYRPRPQRPPVPALVQASAKRRRLGELHRAAERRRTTTAVAAPPNMPRQRRAGSASATRARRRANRQGPDNRRP